MKAAPLSATAPWLAYGDRVKTATMTRVGALAWRLAHAMGMGSDVDRRSRRLILAIDCILNQNARDRGAATFAALNAEVLRLCQANEVGILQIPCPEMQFLGLVRTRPRDVYKKRARYRGGSQALQRHERGHR
jgi:hypothetical protein